MTVDDLRAASGTVDAAFAKVFNGSTLEAAVDAHLAEMEADRVRRAEHRGPSARRRTDAR